MNRRIWHAALAAGLALASACAAPPADDSPHVSVAVAPLSLPGITNAVYEVTVRSGAGEVVVSRTLDADGYGDGASSLSFVAPCDADAPAHTVELTVLELYEGDPATLVDPATWQSPGTVTRAFSCVANRDVSVTFDLAVLRQARQGFFDVAVEFDDIFCSAKLDCKDADGQPLHLLFDADGTRSTTLVSGLACTAGLDSTTTLFRDDVVLTCGGQSVTVDPAAGPGNLSVGGGISGASGLLFGAATFRGEEHLGFNKRYWNVALGLEPGVASCTLTTTATAGGPDLAGLSTPDGAVYPVIRWDVDVTDADGSLICSQHPVNATGANAGVATRYASATQLFQHADPPYEVTYPAAGAVDAVSKALDSGTLLLGPNGVFVMYTDVTDPARKVLKIARYLGGAWQIETVMADAGATHGSAAIDASGALHTVFTLQNQLFYATNASGGWVAEVIPGPPVGASVSIHDVSMDLDDAGFVHVTSAIHVNTPGRYYTTNVSGSWTATQISSQSSGQGIIAAAGLAAPSLVYAIRPGTGIHYAEGPNWAATERTIYPSWGPDQQPTQALTVHAGQPVTAVGLYYGYNAGDPGSLRIEERAPDGTWTTENVFTFASNLQVGFGAMDLAVDAAGHRFVALCDRQRNLAVWSNASGTWQVTPGGRCAGSMVDVLLANGALYVSYAAETTQALMIDAYDVTTL